MMASFIPIEGEVECRSPPMSRGDIDRILGIPKGRIAQYRLDENGGSWWFWKTGRDLKKRNVRAKRWFHASAPDRAYVYFEGPVLYLSAKETWPLTRGRTLG